MDHNKSQQRISIIKSALKKEDSGIIYEDMTQRQRTQLCSSFEVPENEIVGYYQDIMNLGKTILASAKGTLVNQGLLFLKEALLYRKSLLFGVIKVFYDDIKLVEKGSFGTKIHYSKNGTPTTLTLSGIAYADSNETIPDLLINLQNLNSEKSAKTAFQDNKEQENQDSCSYFTMSAEQLRQELSDTEKELEKLEEELEELEDLDEEDYDEYGFEYEDEYEEKLEEIEGDINVCKFTIGLIKKFLEEKTAK